MSGSIWGLLRESTWRTSSYSKINRIQMPFLVKMVCSAEYLFDLMNRWNMKPTSAGWRVLTRNGKTGLPTTNEAIRILVHSKNKVMSFAAYVLHLSCTLRRSGRAYKTQKTINEIVQKPCSFFLSYAWDLIISSKDIVAFAPSRTTSSKNPGVISTTLCEFNEWALPRQRLK